MRALTREQIARWEEVARINRYLRNETLNGFPVAEFEQMLAALAEVLTQRDRRCGTCRDWARITTDPSDAVRAGYGWCDRGHDSYCGWTPEAGHCHDWTAKEGAKR